MTESPPTRLFTRHAPSRFLYRLYFSLFLTGILSLLYYRLTHIPANHRLVWLLLCLAEFWFSVMWILQQSLRWAPAYHVTYPDLLPANLPPVDVMVCTADPEREPAALVANTLLSLMAYDYDVSKLAFYLSDDGGSELTFHAAYQVSVFARDWLPFCRKYSIEPRAPQAYFSTDISFAGSGSEAFRQDYSSLKKKFEEMQDRMFEAGKNRKVAEDTRTLHKGFAEWESKVNPRDHQSIVQVLLSGNGGDRDAEGKPMPTLVYVSREKRPGQPHNFKAGALNSLNRVSGLISNAPFIATVDCDMYSNNSQALRDAMCFLLDPKESQRIAFVQYPQCFEGITQNDLYCGSLIRICDVEVHGFNMFNGPFYGGTGAVHRREILNGKKYSPDYKPKWDWKPVEEIENWNELEAKAKALISCTYEHGKPWGKEMGVMYGCPVEDLFTGLALHSRGWQSVYFTPERKAFLGLAPRNLSDTLIQYQRWSTGLLVAFLSHLCPLTHGIGKMKLGQIMCYCSFTLWSTWSMPMLFYALLPPLAMANGIPTFPKASDPWFVVFVYLGAAAHAFSLVELISIKGTVKMWWNETRMWMIRGSSSYLIAVIVVILNSIGIAETGFDITSKVLDEKAFKRYKEEVMEFGVPSPMFIPPATLSLLNLYCLIRSTTMIAKYGVSILDHMALQIILSGYISLISLPLYEAMFLRKDQGRMPTSITIYSAVLALALFYLLSPFL